MDTSIQLGGQEDKVVDAFHRLYYESSSQTWQNTYWLGVPVSKCPLDLWIYQEILFETRPEIIVECGTYRGGSALYLASICDMLDNGHIVTIDIKAESALPRHERIRYLQGSSTSEEVIRQVKQLTQGARSVLVILDSDHSRKHVYEEMQEYAPLVTKGSYLIVEDTNIGGHPVHTEISPGPMEAVRDFLESRHDFVVDLERHKFLLSFNPNGYLRKI